MARTGIPAAAPLDRPLCAWSAVALMLVAEVGAERVARAQEPAPEEAVVAVAPSRAAEILDLFERRRAGALDERALRRAVLDLGPETVGDVFELFAGQGLARPDGKPAELLPAEQALILEALRAWPLHDVLARIGAALGEDASLGRRLVALRLVGETQSAEAVDALIELLSGFEPDDLQSRLASDAAARAWTQILRAGGDDALMSLRARRLERSLLPGLVLALESLASGAALPLLAELEGEDAALDALIVDALGAVPRWDVLVLDGSVARMVRGQLEARDANVRRQAALAAGRLCDAEAFLDLVVLLEDDDKRVRRAAQHALQSTTGARDTHGARPWLDWYDREAAWRGREAEKLLGEARTSRAAGAVAALRELSMHPFYREELCEEIAALAYERSEEEVVVAACGALARLQGGTAVATLIELLDDPRSAVPPAALAALRSTTGVTGPLHAEEWRALLEPR